MKEINLEEILKKSMGKNPNKYVFIPGDSASVEKCLVAMKEACKQVLELAAENAKLENVIKLIGNQNKYNTVVPIVKKQSILDTINQVK